MIPDLQNVTELSIEIRRIEFATYTKERGGVTFRRFVLFQRSEEVATDRLLITDEAVRVLDRRQ